MGLALEDMHPKTIVDRIWKWENGKLKTRPEIRRGIIVSVEGDIDQQSVTGVFVQFKKGETAEKIDPAELAKVFPYTSKPAREAWRRLMGGPREVGSVRMNKAAAVRPVHKDEMGVTPLRSSGPGTVEAENYGMDDLIDEQPEEPIVVQDAPEQRRVVPVDDVPEE